MWNESGGLKESAYCGVQSFTLLPTVGYGGGVHNGVLRSLSRDLMQRPMVWPATPIATLMRSAEEKSCSRSWHRQVGRLGF